METVIQTGSTAWYYHHTVM